MHPWKFVSISHNSWFTLLLSDRLKRKKSLVVLMNFDILPLYLYCLCSLVSVSVLVFFFVKYFFVLVWHWIGTCRFKGLIARPLDCGLRQFVSVLVVYCMSFWTILASTIKLRRMEVWMKSLIMLSNLIMVFILFNLVV